jgi:Fe-S-cluster containining protein
MDIPLPRRQSRAQVPAGAELCDHCTAKCCRYFALPIDTPASRQEFDYLRWFLLHERASVFTEGDTWYLLVHTVCKHLQPDNRCGIYADRPQICRDYTTDNCEFDDDWVYDRYFETSEQVAEYMEAVLPRRRGESLRSPKPPVLPIVSS